MARKSEADKLLPVIAFMAVVVFFLSKAAVQGAARPRSVEAKL